MDTATVQRLLDESDLQKLIHQLPWHLDNRDWDALGPLFTEDGVMEIGGEERKGREAIVAGPKGDLEPLYEATYHHMGQTYVSVDGDAATVVAYAVAYHLPKVSEPMRHEDCAGKYHAEAVRTEAGWRFKRIRLEFHWLAGEPFRVLGGAAHRRRPAV